MKSRGRRAKYCSFRFGTEEAVAIDSPVEKRHECYRLFIVREENAHRSIRDIDAKDACLRSVGFSELEEIQVGNVPREALEFIKLYGPYCFAPNASEQYQRPVSVAHVAQSLDGRIATVSGASQWIGNNENLYHAHRMRALCDGVLVGSRTFMADRPKLTVRHVPGKDPTRIVLGSSVENLEISPDSSSGEVWLVGSREAVGNGVDSVHVERGNDGYIPPKAILKELYRKGLHSIFIEGGGVTVSNFLKDGVVDVVQVHFSPMIIGSGKRSFSLPEIQEIAAATRFASHGWIRMDEEIMLVGWFPSGSEENSR